MNVTILTTTYKRPELLKRLGKVIIPIINKFKGNLRWQIIIDDNDNSYDNVLEEFTERVNVKSLINSTKQTNLGKFRSVVNFLNQINSDEWIVNIDDDDLVINYRFENFLDKLDSFKDINAILCPKLILDKSIFHDLFNRKLKLFSKYNNQKMSYFDFKDKFGDVDTIIFFRKFHLNSNTLPEIKSEKFTSESLLWLNLFPNSDLMVVNNHIVYSQYLSSGLTQSTTLNRIFNPVSAISVYKKFLQSKKFSLSKIFIKSLINYYRFSLHAKKKIYIRNENIGNIFIRFLGLNLAKIIYLYDKMLVVIKS